MLPISYDATKFMDHITGIPRLPLTIGFGAMMAGVVYALELYEPSAQEMASYNTSPAASVWEMVAWPSWLSGFILGSLQVSGERERWMFCALFSRSESYTGSLYLCLNSCQASYLLMRHLEVLLRTSVRALSLCQFFLQASRYVFRLITRIL